MTFHISKIIWNHLVQQDCLLSLRCRVKKKRVERNNFFFWLLLFKVTSGARHIDCINMRSIERNEFRKLPARCSCPGYW